MVGPFQEFSLPGGGSAPLYLLRYSAAGALLSPESEAALRERVTAGATDVFLFSHGWNNVFRTAHTRYVDFISGYMKMRVDLGLPVPRLYAPVLVGVIWPSTGFVLPWENGPDIAAADPSADEELLRFVAESLDDRAAATLAELVDRGTGLTGDEAERAAAAVRPVLSTPDEEDKVLPDVANVLAAWRLIDGLSRPAVPADPADFGTFDGGPVAAGPAAAGLEIFDPRNLLRMATLWKMKARAGTVGFHGVGPLLRILREGTNARLHLVGHSFGARVVMSAIVGGAAERKVRSLLLLQAAVNRWCFAPKLPDDAGAAGYHTVPEQVEQPIMATFSVHDLPLHDIFHLVMAKHLGEPNVAAIGNVELYGALGGYGPGGLGEAALTVPIAEPGTPYPALDSAREVLALEGTAAIFGHSDISNPATWWALHCLTADN